jgi:hypothetical protein
MRFRHQRIFPVELWDVLVPGGIVSEHQEQLAHMIDSLRDGRARTRSGKIITECAGFDRVWIAGGRADPPRPFAGVDGGLAHAELVGDLVIDLGQTSAKCGLGDRRWRVERAGRGARDVLTEALVGVSSRNALVGVCAEVFADGSLGPSTYDDLDEELIAELFGANVLIANDAELAALLALRSPECASGKTLVLTLGFGVGGAVITDP